MLCIRYPRPFPTAVIYAFPWRRNAGLFLTAFFIFIARSSFMGPKRRVFPPRFLLGNYSVQIIYCCWGLLPAMQPKWSFPLLSFTPLLLFQQITGMWKHIKWRHFFPKCFSYTQSRIHQIENANLNFLLCTWNRSLYETTESWFQS